MAVTDQDRHSVRLILPVTGMTCGGCASRVQSRLVSEPSVRSASVNLALDRAEIVTEKGAEALPLLVVAVQELGFGVAEERIELSIGGIASDGHARQIEDVLSCMSGVLDAKVNAALNAAQIRAVRGAVEMAGLIASIEAAGCQASPIDNKTATDPAVTMRAQDRRDLIELVIAAALTLPLIGPMVLMIAGLNWHLPVWVEAALATPVQFWIGRRFYYSAWRALKTRAGNMDQLVVLGTSAAYFYSIWLVLSQGALAGGQLYFEAAAVIVTLVLTGKYLENRAKRSASEALRELSALQPEQARLLRGGREVMVSIDEVALSDVVIVKPGELVPIDGSIIDGASDLDENLLTGECMPVYRVAGDAVVAGAINGSGLLRLRTERIGKATALARIARMVSEAQTGKAPIQRIVDKISSIFVPMVLLMAALTWLGWIAAGQAFEPSLAAAISVLVIACPCALGLATPTALVAGTGAAARHGILIKDIETLERAHRIDTVVFDKTGTLTMGRPEVTAIEAIDGDRMRLLRLAASAQTGSEHPLARGIVRAAKNEDMALMPIRRFQAHIGQGIEAETGGHKLRIGRADFTAGNIKEQWLDRARDLEERGQTVVWLAVDGVLAGLIALADTVRDDAASTVAALQSRDIEVILLTGDNVATARRIGRDLGINHVQAEHRPEDKARTIAALVKEGRCVAMVGDGINDAPALAAATVGIAIGGGAATAVEVAGITLMQPKPSLLIDAMTIAAKTSSKIRQNLFWAFIYNLIGLPVAAFGLLNPAIAGAAMALSSVSVVANALTLKRWRPHATSDLGASRHK